MVRVFSLMKRREDMSLEEFRHWAFNEHPELGKKIPGMRRYHMSCVLEDAGTPFDVVSEFWFDDLEALQAGFATPEGKAAGGDAAPHCSHRVRLVTEDRVIIP
ncbi:MAG: EthD family reductase [Caldilineales bacterium]